MGNKRSWAPPNKKSNNWKYIKKIRGTTIKPKNQNVSPAHTAEYENDAIDEAILIDTACSSANHAVNECDNDEIEIVPKRERTVSPACSSTSHAVNECDNGEIEIVPKRERTVSPEMNEVTFLETSNMYEWLSETDGEEETLDDDPLTNDQLNENEDNSEVEENYLHENVSESVCDEDEAEYNIDENDLSNDSDEEVVQEEEVSGRRIFEVAELFESIKRIGNHSKNCSFQDMTLIGETKKGLNSIFKFRCDKCGTLRNLQSCPNKNGFFNCNEEAVLAINMIGSGFYHLEEFLSNLNVPCMGGTLYNSISKLQQADWEALAKKSAVNSLKEEVELAAAAGEIDVKGNALVAVIADGGWAKRSYGKKFNSLSGCAVLIGVRTKKVVFYGTRSKYCHVCKSHKGDDPPKEHECNINYKGPSSGMEADIILEGFKYSEQHGARFHKLIADGDSTTYKILRDYRVYKDPDLVIEKLECVNHLCRNFRSKFGFLEKVCKFDSKLRKQVKPSKANDMCKGVKTAAKHYRNQNMSLRKKMACLEEDVMNCPLHYYGVHTKCKPYFCSKKTTNAALKNLQLLKEDGLWYEILNLVQVYFASNSKSLLENYTNNPAEEFNNIVAKYLGGKRINFSLGRSYPARVAAAVVQTNSRGHAATEFRKFVFGDEQESSTKKLELNRKRKLYSNAAALATKPRNRHRKEDNSTGDYLHGEGFQDVDKPKRDLDKCKEIFLKKLDAKQQIRQRIERMTLDKEFDSYWKEVRQDLLPSNHFHSIIKAQSRRSYTKKLKEIMYNRSEFGNSAQNLHQRLIEREALEKFKEVFQDEIVRECGLFIDKELSFLCSSPFRLCGENHILSIKCPKKQYGKNFDEAMKTLNFFKKQADHFIINEKSDWYIELQSDLHITEKQYGYLMIYLGESSYRIIEIAKSDDFFQKMIPELTYFYMEVMLTELVDPRNRRRMDLRKYDPATDSFI